MLRKEEKEGWAPSMLLREIATSQPHAREKGKHAVRAMLRDNLHNTISGITGKKIEKHAHVSLLTFFLFRW